jgi:hypothetical protein
MKHAIAILLWMIIVIRPVYTLGGYFDNHLASGPNLYDVNYDNIVNWQDYALLINAGLLEGSK